MSCTPAQPCLPASWTEWSGLSALAILKRLQEQGLARWHPYDAPHATRFRRAVEPNTATRRLTVQAVKRSPLPLQSLPGAQPAASAYTLGHGMMACARSHKAGSRLSCQ